MQLVVRLRRTPLTAEPGSLVVDRGDLGPPAYRRCPPCPGTAADPCSGPHPGNPRTERCLLRPDSHRRPTVHSGAGHPGAGRPDLSDPGGHAVTGAQQLISHLGTHAPTCLPYADKPGSQRPPGCPCPRCPTYPDKRRPAAHVDWGRRDEVRRAYSGLARPVRADSRASTGIERPVSGDPYGSNKRRNEPQSGGSDRDQGEDPDDSSNQRTARAGRRRSE